MKKITFLLLSLLSLGATAQTLTHSTSMTVANTNVACNSGTAPNTTSSDNAYFRFFNLASFGVTGAYDVTNVQYGVATLRTPTLLAGFPVTVKLYTTTSATFPTGFPASYTEVATATTFIQELQAGTLITVPITATIPAGSNLLVSVSYAAQEAASLNQIFLAANSLGQTAQTYIQSTACSILTPSTMASIGFPNAHFVLAVNALPLSVKENNLKALAVYPNPTKDILKFDLPQNVELQKVNLSDITGKQIELAVSNNSVDIARFAPGVYMLTIQTNEGNVTKKVVKN